MPSTLSIYLPLNTYVSVRSFTNAGFLQRVTMLEENGTQHQYQGSGEHDTPMAGGAFAIQTPGTSKSPMGYQVSVNIDAYNGSSWQPSSISQGSCSVMYYYLAMIVSEDYIDNDWNDCAVQFTWWQPPNMRLKHLM